MQARKGEEGEKVPPAARCMTQVYTADLRNDKVHTQPARMKEGQPRRLKATIKLQHSLTTSQLQEGREKNIRIEGRNDERGSSIKTNND